MRVGFHSPLPPERSGIADYSYELLEELRHHVEVVAVVRDDLVGTDRAPEGVEVVGCSQLGVDDVDVDVYQMGNNPRYHRFLYARALERPGLLVLHDPSLADYHSEMCRSPESGVFRHEIAFDDPGIPLEAELPLVDVGEGRRDLDRLEVLLARRVVEASVRTLVHSSAIAEAMRARYRGADVTTIRLPAPVVPERPGLARRPGEVTFGVFGGINYYKRIDAVVEAFRQVRPRFPLARLVIAGRPDEREMTARLRRLAASEELGGALEVHTELTLAELEAEMHACDVAVSLRWPTAGEMSATLMRAFGAGRPAVVTDVLQFRELDGRFCWRVPIGDEEVPRLVEVLSAAAEDPARCVEAGRAARRFVEREATYAVVGEQYVAHLEHCRRLRRAKAAAVASRSLAAHAVLGVALLDAYPREGEGRDAVTATATALGRAGVDVVDLPPPPGADGPVERLAPARVVASRRSLAAARKSASRGRRPVGGASPVRSRPDRFRLEGRAASSVVEVGELHDVVVCHVDARRAPLVGRALRDHHRRGRRTVAIVLPDAVPLSRSFERVLRHADEIWAPSWFAADLLASTPTGPVVVVPTPFDRSAIAVPLPAPDGPLRVAVVVDGAAGLARANPLGAVAAFAAAFGTKAGGLPAGSERPARLELVVRNVPATRAAAVLAAALATVDGRLVLAATGAEVGERLAAAEVVLSLHRTDAAGQWCLSAMAAGRPVVGTAYGGWTDVATGSSACLVGFDSEAVSEGEYLLDAPGEWGVEPGQRWASPALDQAAGWLRRLAADRRLVRRVGAAARQAVEAQPDEAAVGALMRARLEALSHQSAFDEGKRRRREARLALARPTGASAAGGGRR